MRRTYTPIDETLKALFGATPQLRELWQLILIRDAWQQLPELFLQNSSPVDLKGGVLIVETSSTVWVQELAMKRRQLMAHIGTVHPSCVPREIRFRLSSRKYQGPKVPTHERTTTPLIPTPGSPAWEALREVRELAAESEYPWASWFLKITEEWFVPPPKQDK